MASAASPSPISHSQRVTTERRRTLQWLLACVCCLALGSIATFASVQNARERSWRVTTNKHVTTRLELLQTEPSPSRFSSKNHTTPDDSPSANASTGITSDRYARGVIVSVHNGIVSMAVSLLRELRCLGNREVIQVYHCFPDELSPASQALLTRNDPNVEIVDVCSEILNRSGLGDDIDDVFRGDRALAESFRSYWLKPLALYHTKIREVVLLDADAVLMRDPASLRALSGYQRTGTTFFYDRVVKIRRFFNNAVTGTNGTTGNTTTIQLLHHLVATFDYAQFGLDGPAPSLQLRNSLAYAQATAHEQDSSMVLVDKTRAGKALAVLRHLITRVRFQFAFSWGDKEAFWLAFELAHQPYFFSPYGLSLVDSVPNRDLEQHPDTLCGSMAHFVPTNANAPPELLYVNGKALLEPFPLGLDKSLAAERSRMFNVNPTHVTPRYVRRRRPDSAAAVSFASFECLERMGATPLPRSFYARLLRRRTHYFAAETRFLRGLDACELEELIEEDGELRDE